VYGDLKQLTVQIEMIAKYYSEIASVDSKNREQQAFIVLPFDSAKLLGTFYQ
jgi:hypothetical protein